VFRGKTDGEIGAFKTLGEWQNGMSCTLRDTSIQHQELPLNFAESPGTIGK